MNNGRVDIFEATRLLLIHPSLVENIAQIKYDASIRTEIDLNIIGKDAEGNYMEQTIMAYNYGYDTREINNIRHGYHKYAGMSFGGYHWSPDALPDDKGH